MKPSAISVFLILLADLTGCHPDAVSPAFTKPGPQVKTTKYFCLDNLRPISEDYSVYNSDSLKISEVYFLHGFTTFDYKDSTVFTYDQAKKLQHEITYTFEVKGQPYSSKTDQHLEYTGNNLTHRVTVTKSAQSPDSTVSDILYYYSNGLRVRMDMTTTYTYDHTSRFYTEVYDYSGSLMTTKLISVDGSLYRVINYYYSNGKLVKEEDFNSARTLINTVIYTYDDNDLLVSDTSSDYQNKYFYTNGLLTEQHQTYSGIDPGYNSCYGNFKITYQY